jgi:hypothetical protein
MYRTESTRCGPTHCSTTHAMSERRAGARHTIGPWLYSRHNILSTKQLLQKSEHRTTLARVHFDWGRSVGDPWWARGPRAQTPVPFPFTIHTSLKGIPHVRAVVGARGRRHVMTLRRRRLGARLKGAVHGGGATSLIKATAPRGASQRGCARRRCNLVNKGDGA